MILPKVFQFKTMADEFSQNDLRKISFRRRPLAIHCFGRADLSDAEAIKKLQNRFPNIGDSQIMSVATMPESSTCSTSSVVTITEKAAGEMHRVLSDKKLPESTVLRIGINGGGCSGFSYNLGFDDKFDEMNDVVTDQHGLKVAVDRKSAMFLEGTTIDFYDGIERRGFTFENPNAKKSCGCGSSFSV